MEKNEQLFYDKLKDIFIGAKIESKSGFLKLMKIKSSYFDAVSTKKRRKLKVYIGLWYKNETK